MSVIVAVGDAVVVAVAGAVVVVVETNVVFEGMSISGFVVVKHEFDALLPFLLFSERGRDLT